MSVPYRTNSYGFYLSSVSALIGVDQADLQATELTFLNVFFNRAVRKIWEMQTWRDLCPYGEVRFPTNAITYPNDLSQTGFWTANSATWGGSYTNNPLDNRQTASLLSPGSGSFSAAQSISQPVALIPAQSYQASGYFAPVTPGFGGILNCAIVSVFDGVFTYTAGFNCSLPNPSVVATSVSPTNGIVPQAAVSASANGFVKWSMSFTAASVALSSPGGANGQLNLYLSPDGVTTNYIGNPYHTAGAGAYSWGVTLYAQSNQLPASYIIPWSQLGESAIDTVFEVWGSDPGAALIGARVPYKENPNGIELIGCAPPGPIYLYYRPQRPVWAGATWSAAGPYSAGVTVYYTSVSGSINYWTSNTSTFAGQSPDTAPTSWNVIPVPYVLFEYIVHNAYADWLQTEGQTAKAQVMYQYAQTCIDDENDKLERQSGNIQPWRVATHITSQNRSMGWGGYNFGNSNNALLGN
jgi:hypothetical protein